MNAFEQAAAILGVGSNFIKRLKTPDRIVFAQIPLVRDNGEEMYYDAYRVQHHRGRGPYKGGIRFHPEVDLEEVKHLAFWMAMKTSVLDLPLGGGKGGVVVDPKTLSPRELEALSRGFVRAFFPVLGPHQDIPAPDVYTTPQIMAWMADEYIKCSKDPNGAATFTGKPLEAGGSEGRDIATAQGGFYLVEELIKLKKLPAQPTVVIQGFGNAGSVFATLANAASFSVVGLSDSKGGISSPQGIHVRNAIQYKERQGSLQGFPGCAAISQAELLTLPCDLLVPAALSDQITASIAQNLQAKVVLELANGPTTAEADQALASRNILLVPDILANAGGVTVSYFEWEQNLQKEHWSKEKVLTALKEKIVKNFQEVWSRSVQHRIDLRTAAYLLALERLRASVDANTLETIHPSI